MFYCSQLLSLSIPCAPHLEEIQTGSALSFDTSGRFKPERSHPQPALPTNHSETPTQPPSLALPRYFWTSSGGLPCPPQNLITIDLLAPCWDVCGIISLNIYIMFCPQLATRNTDTLLCILHVLPILLSGKLRNMRADYGIPWQAVVRTQYLHCCGPGSILGWGTKPPKSPGVPPPASK